MSHAKRSQAIEHLDRYDNMLLAQVLIEFCTQATLPTRPDAAPHGLVTSLSEAGGASKDGGS